MLVPCDYQSRSGERWIVQGERNLTGVSESDGQAREYEGHQVVRMPARPAKRGFVHPRAAGKLILWWDYRGAAPDGRVSA